MRTVAKAENANVQISLIICILCSKGNRLALSMEEDFWMGQRFPGLLLLFSVVQCFTAVVIAF